MKGEKSGFFFDKYKVLYLVGTGTFARVYRAVHSETGEVRALKVLRSRFSDRPDQYGRFVREGKMGCTLRHTNIVRIDEVFSQGYTHFFVMEFVEGRNLRDFVKVRKKLDPLDATRLMLDIADGLRYAFERGFTHRDIKMSNILVSSRGQAKLVDFGLAAMDETLTDAELERMPNLRTIDYAALERATGCRKDDTRSDLYFLGCVYYNMLTGTPPLSETRDRIARLSKQRFLDAVPILKADRTLPHCVAQVVMKAMSLDPSKRYQTPATMLNDLEIAYRRLTEMAQSGDATALADDTQVEGSGSSPALLKSPLLDRTVMVVESDGQLQDIFRKGFKKAGAKVLLTSDPGRAFDRLRQDADTAQGLVVDAELLGRPALEMFNELANHSETDGLPALLLLGPNQKAWAKEVRRAPHRGAVLTPIGMKQLHDALCKLIRAKSPAENNSEKSAPPD
jgi:eukaryotic-like serine/threonine-protein kinase